MSTYLVRSRSESRIDPLASESYRIDFTTGQIDDSIDESMLRPVGVRRRRRRSRRLSSAAQVPMLALGPFLLVASIFVKSDDSG